MMMMMMMTSMMMMMMMMMMTLMMMNVSELKTTIFPKIRHQVSYHKMVYNSYSFSVYSDVP